MLFIRLAVAVILTVAPCTATSCSNPPPCGYIGREVVFFVGSLIGESVALPSDGSAIEQFPGGGPPHQARFRVEEALFGIEPATPEVVVITPGKWFSPGHRGLVHGVRSAGVIRTGICGATFRVDMHDDLIHYLRAVRQGKGETTAKVHVRDARLRRAVVGVTVTLGQGMESVTDASGAAVFSGLKPGIYYARPTTPGFMLADGYTHPPLEVAFGACSFTVLFVTGASAVSGRVLDSAGHALPRVSLKLQAVPVTDAHDAFRSRSDSEGLFRFRDIPPGLYALSVDQNARGPSWFPGRRSSAEATPIMVEAGHDLTGLQFTLTASGAARTLRLRIVHESGAPVTDVDILDWAHSVRSGSCSTIGSLGGREQVTPGSLITRTVFDGVCYRVRAFERTKESGPYYASDPVDIGPIAGDVAVTLVLKNVSRVRRQ